MSGDVGNTDLINLIILRTTCPTWVVGGTPRSWEPILGKEIVPVVPEALATHAPIIDQDGGMGKWMIFPGLLAVVVLTVVIGHLNSRGVYDRSALEVLRSEI